jgi:hypothetical protein
LPSLKRGCRPRPAGDLLKQNTRATLLIARVYAFTVFYRRSILLWTIGRRIMSRPRIEAKTASLPITMLSAIRTRLLTKNLHIPTKNIQSIYIIVATIFVSYITRGNLSRNF